MSSLPSTPTISNAPGILERFHPAVRVWFERRFPDGPTEAQAGAGPAGRTGEFPEIDRHLYRSEFKRALELADALGLRRLDDRSRAAMRRLAA